MGTVKASLVIGESIGIIINTVSKSILNILPKNMAPIILKHIMRNVTNKLNISTSSTKSTTMLKLQENGTIVEIQIKRFVLRNADRASCKLKYFTNHTLWTTFNVWKAC